MEFSRDAGIEARIDREGVPDSETDADFLASQIRI